MYDEATNTFFTIPSKKLVLEHSLVSISKWESKWHKPYLQNPNLRRYTAERTQDEFRDYVRCMTIGDNIDPVVYLGLSRKNYKDIGDYINDPMSATTISSIGDKRNSDIITSELIYYWMTELNIPFYPCEKWHLNRLLKLIEVCALKKEKPKKMSPSAIAKRNHSLNAARKAKHHTRG